jgi:hypothetical protein
MNLMQDIAIKKVRRVGKRPATTEARPRTIVVEIEQESFTARCTALKNRSMLKERVEYSNVYIMPDMSDNERWMEYEYVR